MVCRIYCRKPCTPRMSYQDDAGRLSCILWNLTVKFVYERVYIEPRLHGLDNAVYCSGFDIRRDLSGVILAIRPKDAWIRRLPCLRTVEISHMAIGRITLPPAYLFAFSRWMAANYVKYFRDYNMNRLIFYKHGRDYVFHAWAIVMTGCNSRRYDRRTVLWFVLPFRVRQQSTVPTLPI